MRSLLFALAAVAHLSLVRSDPISVLSAAVAGHAREIASRTVPDLAADAGAEPLVSDVIGDDGEVLVSKDTAAADAPSSSSSSSSSAYSAGGKQGEDSAASMFPAASASIALVASADALSHQLECAVLVRQAMEKENKDKKASGGEVGKDDKKAANDDDDDDGEDAYMSEDVRSRGVTDEDAADAIRFAPAEVDAAAEWISALAAEDPAAVAGITAVYTGRAGVPVRSAALAFVIAERTYALSGNCAIVDAAMRAAVSLLESRRVHGVEQYCAVPSPTRVAGTLTSTLGRPVVRDLRSVRTGAVESMSWDYMHHCALHTGDHMAAYEAGHRYGRLRHDNIDLALNMRRARLHTPLDDGYAFVSSLSLGDILAGRIRPSDAHRGPGWANEAAGLFVVTVATEQDPGLDVLRASCEDYGINLRVAAMGKRFSGYGLKLRVLREELSAALALGYTRFLFVDAFDTAIVSPVAEIVSKLDHFASEGHDVVVSAESSCWPDPSLCDLFPRVETPYRYPNTGGMAGSIAAFLELLDTMGVADKPVCVDDQHEMQLVYLAYPTTAYKLDTDAILFHSLVNAEQDLMMLRRPRTKSTGTAPSVFHANGYDKTALGRVLLARNWFHSDWEASRFFTLAFHSHRDKTVERDGGVPRCYNVSIDYAADNYPATGVEFDGTHGADPHAENGHNGDSNLSPVNISEVDTGEFAALRNAAMAELRAISDDEGTAASRERYLRSLADITGRLRSMVRSIERTVFFNLPEHRAVCASDVDPAERSLAHCRTDPTLPECFNFEKCGKGGGMVKLYVYPDSAEGDAEGRVSVPYAALLRALRRSPRVTDDPGEACLFVPSIDTYCTLESCLVQDWLDHPARQTGYAVELGERLRALPHWDGGRNHIIFQHHELPCSPFPIGAAILAKTDISDFHYRFGHDVSLPYVPLRQFGNAKARGANESSSGGEAEGKDRVQDRERKYLAVFKGARTTLAQASRERVTDLHDPDHGVVVLSLCRVFGYVDERCRDEERDYVMYPYDDLLLGAHYGLVLEGFGYGSYRLLEVMAAGAIPVLAVDHWIPPLSEALDWSEFAVIAPQRTVADGTIVDTLAAIPEARRERLRAKGKAVYERFFVSQERNVLTAVEIVAARVKGERLADVAGRELPGNPAMTNEETSRHFLASDLYWPNTMPRESDDQLP